MTVDVSVLVPTGAEETYTWLTEPARLRRWQIVTGRMDLRVGGEFRWLVVPGHTALGAYTAIEPGRRLACTWGWEGDEEVPPGSSTVEITIEPAAGGSEVRLVHEGLSDTQAKGHHEGWTHYLDRLKAVTTSGDAGPDEFAAMQDLTLLNAAEASLALCLPVLREMGANRGTSSTPCEKFTVDDLVDHLLGSLTGLAAMTGRPFEAATDGTPEERVADAGQRVTEAWRIRGVDGAVPAGPQELPADLAASILSVEFLVHAWDFAQAAGLPFTAPDELTGYVLEQVRRLDAAVDLRAGGQFQAETPVGADAGALDKLIAFTGRAA
ncbi:TIGR03086 family metal-binding protein [Kutzneria buriramensis]|uniref:Uncharacterized protein (TIGR03086 family) n=1 Tax=Kutzneria buriramensis TaxID=1045776 RepID=A0A3E0I9G5_9PSEU|nr:TIGR03086 family metal-binding protein [Kutzneria buriramensis]REH55384.1 uncharacterized protein (TIGR03086 family) [Kutzneria buriramensis]